MKDYKDLFLESASGFAMPFMTEDSEDVQITLDYGEQVHPLTGDKFFHRGLDLVCDHKPLFALATGVVKGLGTDPILEHYIIIKYGKFDVKYGHLSEAYINYGSAVTAGMQVGVSGGFLHIEVSVEGEVIKTQDFLGMLWSNILQLAALGIKGHYKLANTNVKVHTDYDKDEEEILRMMLRWFPEYMNDLRLGVYTPPYHVESSLRNIFAQSAEKKYFFERIPEISNPLGLSERSAPLVSKVQNLLIGDFLNYLALKHKTFLSSWGEAEKKNFMSKHQPTGS